MSEQVRQIAQRIKALREIAGRSPETMAEAFSIPPERYERYESGETDIPVSFLYEVARYFDVELTALLTGGEPRLKRYTVVRNGEGPEVERRREYRYRDLAYNFVHKKLEAFLVTVDPDDGSGVNCYRHPGQEFNYVIEGTLKVSLDGHEVVLREGDSLFFDSGSSHGMTALDGKPARFLAVIV